MKWRPNSVATKQPTYGFPKWIPGFQAQMMDTKRPLRVFLLTSWYHSGFWENVNTDNLTKELHNYNTPSLFLKIVTFWFPQVGISPRSPATPWFWPSPTRYGVYVDLWPHPRLDPSRLSRHHATTFTDAFHCGHWYSTEYFWSRH
jgi:hypothetical protein